MYYEITKVKKIRLRATTHGDLAALQTRDCCASLARLDQISIAIVSTAIVSGFYIAFAALLEIARVCKGWLLRLHRVFIAIVSIKLWLYRICIAFAALLEIARVCKDWWLATAAHFNLYKHAAKSRSVYSALNWTKRTCWKIFGNIKKQ